MLLRTHIVYPDSLFPAHDNLVNHVAESVGAEICDSYRKSKQNERHLFFDVPIESINEFALKAKSLKCHIDVIKTFKDNLNNLVQEELYEEASRVKKMQDELCMK